MARGYYCFTRATFFNTGIATYFWILTNKKSEERKGKVQLIDGSGFWTSMKKSLGNKRREISEDQARQLLEIYLNFKEGEYCQIKNNSFFGYTKVQVEQPLLENGILQKDRNGNIMPDTQKRDYERIPLEQDINEYFKEEVKPHLRTRGWIVQKIRLGMR